MTEVTWAIPASTLAWLEVVPRDRPVAMLIRHSVRGELPPGDAGYALPITELGHRLARELGMRLHGRLRRVHASPLLRTMQTAERLAEGASCDLAIMPDRMLGDPGAFVVDEQASATWATLGHEEVMRRLVHGDDVLPGCADAESAARSLVHHMLATSETTCGVSVFVTHDSLVTATVARLLAEPLTKEDWPWYLEAAFFWMDGGAVRVGYRERRAAVPVPLIRLTERNAVALARRELAAPLGLDCPARFFLAGPVFETLVTGRQPRRLDIRAASPDDQAVLAARLVDRGAECLLEEDDQQEFLLGGRVIRLSLQVESRALKYGFVDSAVSLSEAQVEYTPTDRWRAMTLRSA